MFMVMQDQAENIVDSNIPVPAARHTVRVYPWASMEPGDSFFVPGDATRGVQRRLLSAARSWAEAHGGRYTTRSTVENGVAGVRCWRVE